MPSCKGLSLPTRPIASANSSKISVVWLRESSRANVFTLTPLAVATAMGTICSRTAEGEQFTDEAPTKTGATAFKVETGEALFKGGGATKIGAAPWISGWWYLLGPIYTIRFCRMRQAHDRPTT